MISPAAQRSEQRHSGIRTHGNKREEGHIDDNVVDDRRLPVAVELLDGFNGVGHRVQFTRTRLRGAKTSGAVESEGGEREGMKSGTVGSVSVYKVPDGKQEEREKCAMTSCDPVYARVKAGGAAGSAVGASFPCRPRARPPKIQPMRDSVDCVINAWWSHRRQNVMENIR